jgi:hypothetical protein
MSSQYAAVASRHNFSFIKGLFYEYFWKSIDNTCFFDNSGWCESLKKYKIKVIHGACAGFSLDCLHNMLLLLAGAIFHS